MSLLNEEERAWARDLIAMYDATAKSLRALEGTREMNPEAIAKVERKRDMWKRILEYQNPIPAEAICLYSHEGRQFAVMGDFKNAQESPLGFGNTCQEAIDMLYLNGAQRKIGHPLDDNDYLMDCTFGDAMHQQPGTNED